MEVLFEIAAGIDVHRDTVVVSVRTRRGRRESVETRTFETFRDQLDAMCEWLAKCDVQVVGLESTGVYFRPVVLALRRHASQRPIWLVNAAAVKQVPGRKTDVNDSAWLSKLVMHGLVRPSFVPQEAQEDLRLLTRYRRKSVGEKTSCKNRIIKLLEIAGFKLATVCSDVLGKSGRRMVEALVEGTLSPEQIADLARGRLRSKKGELTRALQGELSLAKRWLLRTLMDQLVQSEARIATVDAKLAELLSSHEGDIALLVQIPGVDRVGAAVVVAEMGVDMSIFASAKRLASWSGLAPGSHESAGNTRDAPTRKGNPYLRTMLVQIAHAAIRTKDSPWRACFARISRSTGSAKKAVFAVAHKICVTLFHVLRDRVYRPFLPPPPTPQQRDHSVRRAVHTLESLGFLVTLAEKAP
jgi:transposase